VDLATPERSAKPVKVKPRRSLAARKLRAKSELSVLSVLLAMVQFHI